MAPQLFQSTFNSFGGRPDVLSVVFEPFLIVTSGGNRYRVSSAEHAGTDPQRSRLVVWFDAAAASRSQVFISLRSRKMPAKLREAP